MRPRPIAAAVVAFAMLSVLVAAAARADPPRSSVVPLPNGRPGIGFDDLRFSPTVGVLAPGARSGKLYVVDPSTLAVRAIDGFATEATYAGGHDQGATSADVGAGLVFVTDRSTRQLSVVDVAQQRIVARAALAASPDYVRYVAPTHEIWVTEPDAAQLEIFTLTGTQPTPAARLATPGGPESLVIDGSRDRAYAHLWDGATLSIDLRKRAVVARWPNGCRGSRGIALDEPRGLVFTGCAEGRVTAADVTHAGKPLTTLDVPARGIDVIAFAPTLRHLYLPGASNALMAIVAVDAAGGLTLVATRPTARGAHCVTTDDRGDAFVCDPSGGQLLVIPDPVR